MAAEQQSVSTSAGALERYDDPVVIKTSRESQSHIHEIDTDSEQSRPACHTAGRGTVEWRVVERADVEWRLDDCQNCSGEIEQADAGSNKSCPFCGDVVKAGNWADHIVECDKSG